MRMSADNHFHAATAQKIGMPTFRSYRKEHILLSPVHAGGYEFSSGLAQLLYVGVDTVVVDIVDHHITLHFEAVSP